MKKITKGFTLVEIMIVVAIIGILVGIAVPGFIKAREKAQTNACQEGQLKMDGAVDNWAIDTGKATGDTAPAASAIIGYNLYLKTAPKCPVGATGGTIIDPPTVGSSSVCPNVATVPLHKRS